MQDKIDKPMIIKSCEYADSRGCLTVLSMYSEVDKDHKILNVVQINTVFSNKKGTLRGLHFQESPYSQAKLIRCYSGSIFSIGVDIRRDSINYGNSTGVILSKENKLSQYLPRGFAHGYLTLEDHCFIQYCVDNHFSKEHAKSIRYDDPELKIDWHISDFIGNDELIISDKDRDAMWFRELKQV